MEVILSINKILIRLTSERWVHIVENHDDLASKFHDVLETVGEPDLVLEGKAGELLAVRRAGALSLIVAYREISATDGFVITAFQTSKINDLLKIKNTVWRKP